jgi:hypothetical protein
LFSLAPSWNMYLRRFFQGIFKEAKRCLKSDGAMCHFIDTSDHWEHRDKSISRVNFLQYSDWLWRLICLHPLNYQNRLRASDYVEMIQGEGFEIVDCRTEVRQQEMLALRTLKLAPRFAAKNPEDLAIITTNILARA